MVRLYADGAASGNPGPGAYATILQYGTHEKVLVQAYRHTTNNRMELMGVIAGLEALTPARQWPVAVYSDASYVVNAFQQGWLQRWLKKGFNKVKNPDLWQRLWKVYQQHQVTMHWVKGHAGHPQNERCDRLAVAAYQRGKEAPHLLATDTYYEAHHP